MYESNLCSLIKQRFKYLIHGNTHGVSINWLTKQKIDVYASTADLISFSPFSQKMDKNDIVVGEEIFNNIVDSKSGIYANGSFDCEKGLASFLYAYIIAAKPVNIVETGVANGITTNVIMKALEKAGGNLHSFDINPQSKNVYSGSGNWNFHLLKENYKDSLLTILPNIPKVDLWIHDSNHGYSWQTFEYRIAKSKLNKLGILVSDDIDASTSWGLNVNKLFTQSYAVYDKRKFFGIAKN